MQTISRLYALAKANKYLLVISVVVVSLFVVMRNAVTKMVLTEMTEFELYAAQAIVRTIIAPIIAFIMWRAGTVRFDRMLKLSPMAKGVIIASTLLGIIIFFLSVTILKQNMLTKVVTLHTAFQITRVPYRLRVVQRETGITRDAWNIPHPCRNGADVLQGRQGPQGRLGIRTITAHQGVL